MFLWFVPLDVYVCVCHSNLANEFLLQHDLPQCNIEDDVYEVSNKLLYFYGVIHLISRKTKGRHFQEEF